MATYIYDEKYIEGIVISDIGESFICISWALSKGLDGYTWSYRAKEIVPFSIVYAEDYLKGKDVI